MVTVLRAEGVRVVIFSNDHQPAHVHVFIGGGEAKIDLMPGSITLVWAKGMSRAEIRTAVRIVGEHQVSLIQRWSEIHG